MGLFSRRNNFDALSEYDKENLFKKIVFVNDLHVTYLKRLILGGTRNADYLSNRHAVATDPGGSFAGIIMTRLIIES